MAPENMNAYTKTLEAILKKYPEAKDIYSEVVGGVFECEETIHPETSFVKANRERIRDRFYHYDLSLNNANDFLCVFKDTLTNAIADEVKSFLYQFRDVCHNLDALENDFYNQIKIKLPEDIRQLCLFISKMNASTKNKMDSWDKLFTTYPSLLDKVTSYAGHMMYSFTDVLHNLASDKEIVARNFDMADYRVSKIDISMGDYHSFGQCVSKIVFTNSLEIIYKPRTAKNELIVCELLDLLKHDLGYLKIGIPKYIDRVTHSWHEKITFKDSLSSEEISRFYENIGAAVGLFHMLNAGDFHFENIICSNDIPFFVDLECIFSGVIKTSDFSNSVLTTCILPGLSGSTVDRFTCGIGERDLNGEVEKQVLYIDEDNEIIKGKQTVKIPNFHNRPVRYRSDISNCELRKSVAKGFECMMNAFSKNIKIISILINKKELPGRLLLRSSKYYGDVINFSSHPRYTLFPKLRSLFIACAVYDKTKPIEIIKYEFQSIYQNIIPIFYYDILNGEFFLGDKTKIELDENSEFFKKLYTFKELNEKHLNNEASTHAMLYQRHLLNMSLWSLLPSVKPLNTNSNDNQEYINFLKGSAVKHNGNDVWLGVKKDYFGATTILKRNDDLYDGLAGPMIIQLCDFIESPTLLKENALFNLYEKADAQREGDTYGIFESNGGLLYIDYLFVKNFGTEHVERFMKRLENVISLFNRNKKFDIISGASGILILCCRVYSKFPNNKLLSIISYLAGQILSSSKKIDDECITWGKKWTGFSHGNSGIAYSLVLANNMLNRKDINTLILKSLNYEKCFKIKSGWKGVEFHDNDTDFNAWCNGAPGIYMSRQAIRAEGLNISGEIMDILESDISHYFKTADARGVNSAKSLCHGIYGNTIIQREDFSSRFPVDLDLNNLSEEKSLMTGAIGAVYANFMLKNNHCDMPNILLLK